MLKCSRSQRMFRHEDTESFTRAALAPAAAHFRQAIHFTGGP